jgi:hypothetical protein
LVGFLFEFALYFSENIINRFYLRSYFCFFLQLYKSFPYSFNQLLFLSIKQWHDFNGFQQIIYLLISDCGLPLHRSAHFFIQYIHLWCVIIALTKSRCLYDNLLMVSVFVQMLSDFKCLFVAISFIINGRLS